MHLLNILFHRAEPMPSRKRTHLARTALAKSAARKTPVQLIHQPLPFKMPGAGNHDIVRHIVPAHIIHERFARKSAHTFLRAQNGVCKRRVLIKQRAERFMRYILRRILRHKNFLANHAFFTFDVGFVKF